MSRMLNFVVALAGLLVLSPVLIIVAVLVKLSSAGPVFFKQERIGRNFRPFLIYKFRTMVSDAPQRGGPITIGRDSRITGIGRYLRKFKIDELPQLINILKGEMNFVGPRPELRQFVDMFRQDYATILRVRPGLTDLASLKYSDEASLLAQSAQPDLEYRTRILPDKIRLAKVYLDRSSLWFDLGLIMRTLLRLCGRDVCPGAVGRD